jgi:hypothetical protein
MGFGGNHHFSADVEDVFAHLCDDDAIRDRYESAGDSEVEVLENQSDGDGWVIRSRRAVTVDLPGFAAKVLKPTNTMLQVDRWSAADSQGARTGTFAIEVDGAPVEVSGTIDLETDGDGCRQTVVGELRVKVPLIGGKIAKWAQGDSQERLEQEFAHTEAAVSP